MSTQGTEVRVPAMVAIEPDAAVLGRPFYVMERLEGRYLADNPPYQMEGWLTEESAEICGAIWRNAIRQIAAVHRLDWQAQGFFPPEAEFDINNNCTLLLDEQIAKFGLNPG